MRCGDIDVTFCRNLQTVFESRKTDQNWLHLADEVLKKKDKQKKQNKKWIVILEKNTNNIDILPQLKFIVC